MNKVWEFAYNADRVWTRVAETAPGDTGTSLRMAPIVGVAQNYAGAEGERIRITHESGGTFSTVHEYNASGLPASIFAAGRSWETWEYAPDGMPVAFRQSAWINGAWTRKTEILKNAVGDTLLQTESVWYDEKWNLQRQNTIGYDAGRRPNDWKTGRSACRMARCSMPADGRCGGRSVLSVPTRTGLP